MWRITEASNSLSTDDAPEQKGSRVESGADGDEEHRSVWVEWCWRDDEGEDGEQAEGEGDARYDPEADICNMFISMVKEQRGRAHLHAEARTSSIPENIMLGAIGIV